MSFLLIFTPILGLFDCLHHGRMASIPISDRGGEELFPFYHDGLQHSFSGAWEPFKIKDISHFPNMPVTAVSGIVISMVLFHIFASSIVLKLILKHPLNTELIIQGIHSFISPPLHYDWELIYRRDMNKLSVLGCWKRYIEPV